MSSILKQLNEEVSKVVQDVSRSIVQVINTGGGAGAGTIWHSDGLIVTNAHVVRNASPQVVLSDGRKLQAKVLAYDTKHDIAALMVDAKDLPTVELGESKNVQPGEWVTSVGHPWGVLGSATSGIVIGLESSPNGLSNSRREFIAVSLHLRPGYSGGPLLDVEGRLIGINTMMNGPDVGIAVPVHVIKRFLHDSLTV